jgi:hypothetical protein
VVEHLSSKREALSSNPSTIKKKIKCKELEIVVHTCNPSPWEAEAGGLRVPGQPGDPQPLQQHSFSLQYGTKGVNRRKVRISE